MYLSTLRESVIQRVPTSEVNRDVYTHPQKPGPESPRKCYWSWEVLEGKLQQLKNN